MSTRVRSPVRGPICAGALAMFAVGALPSPSLGQALVPPPARFALEPTYHLEVHGAAILPLTAQNVCPSGFGCVLGAGFGVGALVERREANGVSLLVGYQVWLLDSAGIYEVGAVHTLRAGFRWVIDDSTRVHPFLEVMAGGLILTDPLAAQTGGALVSAGGGVEVELTETVGVTVGLDVWAIAVGGFRTRDGAQRASNFGVDVLGQLRVGLAVIIGDPNH